MRLTIDGQPRLLIPIQNFRRRFGLPDDFGLPYFERKDWEVGRLDESGEALTGIKQQVLAAVPAQLTVTELLPHSRQLAAIFRDALVRANEQIGLREVEIDFAVDGFQNILHDSVYHLFDLSQQYSGDVPLIRRHFDFETVYQAWLDASVRLLTTEHEYQHGPWHLTVQVIYNAYGRTGLRVTVGDEAHYVLDGQLACPAARFMEELSRKTALALCQAVQV